MTKRKHEEEKNENVEMTESGAGETQSEVEELRAQLEEARKQTEEEHNQYLRALADFSNYRRRTQEEYNRAIQFATEEFILKVLPVIDNFERAIAAAEEMDSAEGVVGGVKLTLKQLKDIIEKEGVQPIDAVGKEFDPMMHEAIMRVETDAYPENTIVEELQTGYMKGDKVVRPSRVKVAVSP